MFKDKGMLIGIVATVLIIGGGIFMFSKTPDPGSSATGTKVSDNILIPQGVYETGGIQNGNYLPASASAKLRLVEFGDMQCPACGAYHPYIKQLLTDYAGKINFVFRNFPLSQHQNAQISSQAVEAAGLQGKYWQMYDKIYDAQSEWSNSTDAAQIFTGFAQSLGLNIDQFKSDLNSDKVKAKINSDKNDGNVVNLSATPTFYLNGFKIENLPPTYESLKTLIESELARQ